VGGLPEVFSTEQTLGPAQYGVLAGIVGVLLAGNFQYGGDSLRVGIKQVTNHLGYVLTDEYYAYVFTIGELFECLFNITHVSTFRHDEKVWPPLLV